MINSRKEINLRAGSDQGFFMLKESSPATFVSFGVRPWVSGKWHKIGNDLWMLSEIMAITVFFWSG